LTTANVDQLNPNLIWRQNQPIFNKRCLFIITVALVASQNTVLDGDQHLLIGQNMVLHNFTVIVALVAN
jgi:hypothetical protein